MREAWKTIDTFYVDDVAYAYQQRYEIHEKTQKDTIVESKFSKEGIGAGMGIGFGMTCVPREEHRLKKLKDTLTDEAKKNLVND